MLHRLSPHVFPFLRVLFVVVFVVALLVLGYSVGLSGLQYQLDNDEVFHANILYQMAIGQHPYSSFFTVYTPVFHWMLMPLYFVFGPTFSLLHILRVCMVMIFFIRIFLTILLLYRMYDKVTAFLLAPLLLLDPFTAFSGMQVRPDNVMLLFIVIGLLALERVVSTNKRLWSFISGMSFGMAVLILLKIFPLVVMVSVMFGTHILSKRSWSLGVRYAIGFFLPVIMFILYYAIVGELSLMIQGVVRDPLLLFQSLLNPSTFLPFYLPPNNTLLYGATGKPLMWWFTILLPNVALSGIVVTISRWWKKKSIPLVPSILVFGCLVQGIYIFVSPTVFIQYFLPFNFLLVIFAAVGIAFVYQKIRKVFNSVAIITIGMLLFIPMVVVSVRIHRSRATITNTSYEAYITQLWRIIPPSEPSFPNILFRPSVYPLLTGSFYGDVPPSILERFPDIAQVLESRHVNYLVLSDYYRSFLPIHVQAYIDEHFIRTDAVAGVYRRK